MSVFHQAGQKVYTFFRAPGALGKDGRLCIQRLRIDGDLITETAQSRPHFFTVAWRKVRHDIMFGSGI